MEATKQFSIFGHSEKVFPTASSMANALSASVDLNGDLLLGYTAAYTQDTIFITTPCP